MSLGRSLNRHRARHVAFARKAGVKNRAFLARLLASRGETID